MGRIAQPKDPITELRERVLSACPKHPDRVRKRGGEPNIAALVDATGVPHHSLYRFLIMEKGKPHPDYVAKLNKWLEAQE